MASIAEQFEENLAKMSPEKRADMRRVLIGEDKNDLLRREDVYEAIRKLRTHPTVPSVEFQKGLAAAIRAISDIHGFREKTKTSCTCMTELEDDGYGDGGPMSGRVRPPVCLVHPNQDGKMRRHD